MPRVQVTISDEMKEYFENLSRETGATQSAIMCMALREYIDQKKMLSMMNPMLEQMKMFGDMKGLK